MQGVITDISVNIKHKITNTVNVVSEKQETFFWQLLVVIFQVIKYFY